MGRQKKVLQVDFDGVIHSYKSGWRGVDVIPDDPVEDAFEWLTALLDSGEVDVCIYSSRSSDPKGVAAMKAWFAERGFTRVDEIQFPTQKQAAWLTIDDRAICFMGVFPKLVDVLNFKPWNKKEDFVPLREGEEPIHPDDLGALATTFGIDSESFHIIQDFGKPVTWLALDPDGAERYGFMLLKLAKQARAMKERN